MKLYASLTSPYARKVRAIIHEKELPVDFVAVDTVTDPRVSALNPLGKVPVLQRDDGSVLFDSPVIVEYLDSLKTPTLIPASGEARWQALCLAALADGIMDAAVVRVMELRRHEAQRSNEVIAHQEGKIARAIAFAEKQVGDRPWLVGNHITIADISMATALEYVDFRYPHAWKLSHPRLASWLATVSTRRSLIGTQPPR